jgi:Holliday junction resolvase RusA-like endonuclease
MEGEKPLVVLPFLPPSSNNIYVTNRQGGRFLSSEAKEFKTRAISFIQSNCLAEIGKLDRNGVYRVWYAFYFPLEDIINKTFGNGKKGAASTLYKKMDVENRVKLVADALATAIGIDDCQFFEGGHTKMSNSFSNGQSQLSIYLRPDDPSRFGIA